MNTARARHVVQTAAAVLLGLAVAAAPALTYAQHSGGGGGGGGGGHGGGGGGGHVSGGAHGGGGHAMGGARFGGGAHVAAPHFAAGGHYYSAPHGGFAATHFAAPHSGWVGGYHGAGAGWARGNGYWHGGHYWGGGYWHGVFWPHVWFNPGYAWFLPVLPLGYATFWWGGLPYYYWNNVYYTWSPGYNGYVVTDPPPVAGQTGDVSADNGDNDDSGQYAQSAPPQYSDAAPPAGAVPPGAAPPAGASPSGAGADVFLYPRNGQSDAQTQNDRYECHSWAANQTGFDPTRPGTQSGGNLADYRRAMIACLDARGYSAR
ncbi:MAG TPA: hypothetical protein VK803_01545 [Steroidobacteraceae bacterium]|nr:hypothetical protein [Steroidobacteraceae bacterium]